MGDHELIAAAGDAPRSLLQRYRRRGPTDPGMLGSSRSFPAAIGSMIEPGGVGGYYIDFSFKATSPSWPPAWRTEIAKHFHVATAQWGLGAYERFLRGEGEVWLQAARAAGDALVSSQQDDGSWPHLVAMPHTFRLEPPWLSAMAQGEAASLLVRLHAQGREPRYAESARRALRSFAVPVAEGGVRTELGDGPFFEEYPTSPASLVLNGGIFALWGSYDVSVALGDSSAAEDFERGVDALAANIHRFDNGYWSLYDLFPHPIPNVSSSAYHALHIDQLEAMQRIAPRAEVADTIARFRRYTESRAGRSRAFAAKVAFRLAVPRNALFAHRMPWSQRG
jgi:heparosan-N-sulfate-glucuronate 5-epimerase